MFDHYQKKVSTDQKLKGFSGLVPYFGGWWIRKRPDPEIWSLLLISLSILDNLLKKENYFCENLGNSFIYALDLLAQSTPRWTFPALYQNSHVLIIFCGWPLPLIKKKLPTDKETGLVPYFGSWWIRKWPDLEIWSMLLISLLILGYLLKKEKKIPEKDRQKGNFKNFECLR